MDSRILTTIVIMVTAQLLVNSVADVATGGWMPGAQRLMNVSASHGIKASSEEETKLLLYMNAVSKGLDARPRGVLPQLDGLGRRLLALRGYLRHSGIRSAWTWTPKEARRYMFSSEYRQSMEAVEKVKLKFAELNPGYYLKVNTFVRTLDDQIANWNQAGSVTSTATPLVAAALKTLSDTNAYPPTPDKKSTAAFRKFLTSFKSGSTPTVATPGLSQHGQLRAFDFIIWQGDKIVAGTNAGSVTTMWDRSGWKTKLKEAITQASDRFSGPLDWPDEPWHYEYVR